MITRVIVIRAAAALCLLSGCATEDALDDASSESRCSDGAHCADEPAIPQQQAIVAPALRVAEIRPTGTGCPLGTVYRTNSSGDATLELTFTGYGISLDAGQPVSVKDCQLQIRLQNDQPYRVVGSQVFSGGSATLQSGHTARSYLRAYMQGAPPAGDSSNTKVGPYDGPLTFGVASNAEQTCSAEQVLIVHTRLVVTNASTGTARANNQGPLVIRVKASPC